jgi:hypothetical protein
LYDLLKGVNQRHATLMVTCVPIGFFPPASWGSC